MCQIIMLGFFSIIMKKHSNAATYMPRMFVQHYTRQDIAIQEPANYYASAIEYFT